MNVVFEPSPVVEQVSFDPRSNEIHTLIAGIEFAFPLSEIPEEDFESASPIVGFAIGCEGPSLSASTGMALKPGSLQICGCRKSGLEN